MVNIQINSQKTLDFEQLSFNKKQNKFCCIFAVEKFEKETKKINGFVNKCIYTQQTRSISKPVQETNILGK